ncbi:MAG: choice-of-anchor V domain-containing protein [Blastocatellales bacterium]
MKAGAQPFDEKEALKIMRMSLLKLTIIVSLGALFAISSSMGSPVRAFSSGPFPSLTGAPGESTCRECHSGGPSGGTLSINGLPANYSPNQEITLTVQLAQQNRGRFGFQLTAIDDTGKRAGDLIPNDNRTQTQTNNVNGNQRQYINHTGSGNAPVSSGLGSWTFRWKAPAQGAGRVTFYVAGNAANGNFNQTGDTIYTISQNIQSAPALTNLASVSAASFAGSASLTPDGIVAGFGTGLSQNVALASTVPLPTQLDGTEVLIKDANGAERPAGLFFVAPAQINYLIPAGTANGAATITVRRNGVDAAQGTATIEAVAPALFSANASGRDVAAAVILRRRNGVDTFEPAAQFNSAANRFEPIPIDLGPDADLVVLVAFGTGFRAAPQSAVSATVGGTASTFVATAPAPGFEGLDQANILIPRSLAGRGLVDVVFTANGKAANTVQVNIK